MTASELRHAEAKFFRVQQRIHSNEALRLPMLMMLLLITSMRAEVSTESKGVAE
jgi:hypothetical protein